MLISHDQIAKLYLMYSAVSYGDPITNEATHSISLDFTIFKAYIACLSFKVLFLNNLKSFGNRIQFQMKRYIHPFFLVELLQIHQIHQMHHI